jgi:23S rRNA (pseudouridine1915-N3)-methyltransferase
VKLALIAVGRLKAGPERELVERYRERVDGMARSLGFSPLEVAEIPDRRARREDERRNEEASLILGKAGAARLIVFDERGTSPTSEAFTDRIRRWRDDGRETLPLVIGGPDGLDGSVRKQADMVVSFGALTLPHQLVRVLVVEQIYRTLTILSGHPYHRAGGNET